MSDTKHILTFWRGPRATFNAIETKDYYTRYSVLEADGSWSIYYGEYPAIEGGEKLPVESIIPSESADTIADVEGRFLVESGSGYAIVIHASGSTGEITEKIDPFPINTYSVRVKDQGMKAYVFTDKHIDGVRELITYDDTDLGTWDD